MPIAVRVAPGIGCARNPIASMTLTTASISRAVALGFIAINIFSNGFGLFSLTQTRHLPCEEEREEQRPLSNGRFLSPDYERRDGDKPAICCLSLKDDLSDHGSTV
jgi:hypothetical protein